MRVNKKGSLQDLIFVAIFITMFAVTVLVVYKISDEVNTKFQATDVLPQDSKDAYSTMNSHFTGVIDNSFLLLFIGLLIGTLALAMLVRFHPIFFVFYIFGWVISIFLSAVLSNIYLEIANNPQMSGVAEELIFITNIMAVAPIIIGVFGGLLAVVLYKTWKSGDI